MALPVPVGAAARLCETPVAFARLCLRGVETVIAFAAAGRASTATAIAFAGAGRASTETVIAFAGEKWVLLVHFLGAEVTPVSLILCWGRAVVLLVSTSPRCCASVKSWGCAQVVDGLFVRLLSRRLV